MVKEARESLLVKLVKVLRKISEVVAPFKVDLGNFIF